MPRPKVTRRYQESVLDSSTNPLRNRPSILPRGEISPENSTSSEELSYSSMAEPMPVEVDDIWEFSVKLRFLMQKNPTNWHDLRRILELQKFSEETLIKFNVRATTALDGLIFPRYKHTSTEKNPLKPSGAKVMRLYREKNGRPGIDLEVFPSENPHGFHGMFGWHLVNALDKEVVLAVDELDAMAVYQGCNKKPVLALPQGSNTEKLTPEIVSYLEEFDKVFIWFPKDSMDEAKEVANFLYPISCSLVMDKKGELPLTRPLTFLQRYGSEKMLPVFAKVDADDFTPPGIKRSTYLHRVLPKHAIASSQDIRTDVRDEIIFSEKIARGNAIWERFPSLTRVLLGFRPAELTILTGPTGIGKTTFVSEYSIDLWNQSVSTLFCSFEMSYIRICKMMLCQYSRKPLWRKEHHKEVDKILDRFIRNSLMLFLRHEHFDGQSPHTIMHAIRQQALASDVKHVVIDNLQAMLVGQELKRSGGSARSRAATEDHCILEFRRIAAESKAHITIVMQLPRKDSEGHSSGSTRAMQEADNILVMSRSDRSGKKYLQVSKNRFGGEKIGEDRMEMIFQKETLCHALVDRRLRASE